MAFTFASCAVDRLRRMRVLCVSAELTASLDFADRLSAVAVSARSQPGNISVIAPVKRHPPFLIAVPRDEPAPSSARNYFTGSS
jgi:hypothetical protein